jgi:hypothetical protein
MGIGNAMPRCQPNGGDQSTARVPKRLKKGGAGLDPQGFDAGKKVKGRKRHIVADALGLSLSVVSTLPTCRIAMAPAKCCGWRAVFPFIDRIFSDSGIKGRRWRRPLLTPGAGRDRQAQRGASFRRLA